MRRSTLKKIVRETQPFGLLTSSTFEEEFPPDKVNRWLQQFPAEVRRHELEHLRWWWNSSRRKQESL